MFVPVALGGITVHELFPTGGDRSSTLTSWYESCNHTGEAPVGLAGRTEHDYVVGSYVSTWQGQAKVDRLWYRRFYGDFI